MAREIKREPLAPFFARSLTLVPLFFLLNRIETLAKQARSLSNLASVTIQTLILSCEVAFISIDFFGRVVYTPFHR